MRVFAIAHGLDQAARDRQARRSGILDLLGEPARDRRIIVGGAGKGAGGQTLAQGKVSGSGRGQGLQHHIHRRLIDANGHIAVVLGRRADHGRAANVDILDRRLKRSTRRNGRLERIEVDPHQIDRQDIVRVHGRLVLGRITIAQEAAMHLGVQGLDPAIHHFRKARQIRHVLDRQAGLFNGGAGATGRNQLNAKVHKGLGRFDQARLVGQGDQGTDRLNRIRRRRKIRSSRHGANALSSKKVGGGKSRAPHSTKRPKNHDKKMAARRKPAKT